MVVPSMTRKEITKEFLNDYDAFLNSSTQDRIVVDYNRERLKLKIKKEEDYPKFYEIRTKSKNNWIIKLRKNPLIKKFQYPEDSGLELIMYFHNKYGINVLATTVDYKIAHYYQHFFERFSLRMELNMPNMLDVIKMYFRRNDSHFYNFLPQPDGSIKTLGIVKDGFVYGEMDKVDKWNVNKTFISNKTANYLSTNAEKEFIADIKLCMRNIEKVKDPKLYRILHEVYQVFVPEDEKLEIVKVAPPSPSLIDFKLPDIKPAEPDFATFIKNSTKPVN